MHGLFSSVFLWTLIATGHTSDSIQAPKGGFSEQAVSRFRAVVGPKGMVAADDEASSQWGVEILRRGGNAVDAAVAAAFAMSVTRPHYASLGGGGFFLVCMARKADCQFLDFREVAPALATSDMYVGRGKASVDGPLAVAVPGNVAGLLEAQEKFGKKSRKEVLEKPIKWARDGVVVSALTENSAWDRWPSFNLESKKIFGCGERPCPVGHRLIQKDLSKVLKTISDKGRDGFYLGWVANAIAASVKKAGGILSKDDFKNYRPKFRNPLVMQLDTPVEGFVEVISAPPPSAGGTGLLQMLKWTELAWKQGLLNANSFQSVSGLHFLAHALKLAFSDRAVLFGDPDFTTVSVEKLLSESFLKDRLKTFQKAQAAEVKPSQEFEAPMKSKAATGETTHLSVIDSQGNAVALTFTVNDFFGSGFTAEGTGVVLNNEMDDFASEPGKPNLFGLVGSDANAIAAGKRPLSSMAPTLVRKKGEVILSLGAQGGPRITSSVFQTLVNRLFYGLSLPDAVHAPRIHHQWKPDQVMLESGGFSVDVKKALTSMGYSVKDISNSGRQHAIERFPESRRLWGVADLRTEGKAVAE